jgi:hypothetical protein
VDLLRELFDWITAELGLIPADEWHCGHLPAEGTGPMAVLLERGGTPDRPILRGTVGEYMFQVLTVGGVGSSYFSTRALAHKIHGLLKDRTGVQLADHTVWVIEAVTEPQFLGGDERFRFEISCNYAVRAITDAAWGY